MIESSSRQTVVRRFLLAALSVLALEGCGGPTGSDQTANDASSESVSKYESEIAKSKAATGAKAAK